MAHSILEYKLDIRDTKHVIELPHGSEILSAGGQHNEVVIWVKTPNNEHLTELVTFLVAHTGYDNVSGSDRFIGTGMLFGGDVVFHVFVRGNY